MENIGGIEEKYEVDMIKSYCDNLREAVFRKQSLHILIGSLNVGMGRLTEKVSPSLHAASPPTKIISPPLRRRHSFKNIQFGSLSEMRMYARRPRTQKTIEHTESNLLRQRIFNLESEGSKVEEDSQEILEPLPGNYRKEESIIPVDFLTNKIDSPISPSKDSKIPELSIKLKDTMEIRCLKPKMRRKNSSKSNIIGIKNGDHLLSKINKEIREESKRVIDGVIISKEIGMSGSIKKGEERNVNNINNIKREYIVKNREKDNIGNNIKITDSVAEARIVSIKNKNLPKGTRIWVEKFKEEKFKHNYREYIPQNKLSRGSKASIFPKSPKKGHILHIARPIVDNFNEKLEEFHRRYQTQRDLIDKREFPAISTPTNSPANSEEIKEQNSCFGNMTYMVRNPMFMQLHSQSSLRRTSREEFGGNEMENRLQSLRSEYQHKEEIHNGEDQRNLPMIKHFLTSFNPIIQDHTQSEVGFMQIQPYFADIHINPINRSNYLDQMNSNDRQYFADCQNVILQQIKLIQQEYKRNKLFTQKTIIRSQTIGVIRHENDFDEFLLNPLAKVKK